jgi:DNA gyrase/topoisomerase IV subunit A
MKKVLEEGLGNKFKLSKTFKTTNMVLFNLEQKITKYATINEIMDDFYKLRLEYYEKRKVSRNAAIIGNCFIRSFSNALISRFLFFVYIIRNGLRPS